MTRALHLAEPATGLHSGLLPATSYHYPAGDAFEQASSGRPLEAPETQDLASHLHRFGERPAATGTSGPMLLGILDEVGATGAGGGHFPVARKWRSALRNGGGGIVIANGAESEPASAKDRTLLTLVPHLVLDGLACAAEVLGSTQAVLWLHEDARDARRAVAVAIAERRASGMAELVVRQELAPARYLSGESSAILRSLSGGPALPAFHRRPAAVDGFGGGPAVVHNVETLARIGLLARTGVRGHRPTALVTVTAPAGRTVIECRDAATVGEAVRDGGWRGPDPQAVLVGGYGGSWLPWAVARGVRLRDSDLRKVGAGLGAGVLIPVGAGECGIARAAEIAAFLADAGARQCGPCTFGLPALAQRLAALADGDIRRDEVARLDELAALVVGRGGCHHPDGAARMVTSALRTFASDVKRHAGGRPCAASGTLQAEVG